MEALPSIKNIFKCSNPLKMKTYSRRKNILALSVGLHWREEEVGWARSCIVGVSGIPGVPLLFDLGT